MAGFELQPTQRLDSMDSVMYFIVPKYYGSSGSGLIMHWIPTHYCKQPYVLPVVNLLQQSAYGLITDQIKGGQHASILSYYSNWSMITQ